MSINVTRKVLDQVNHYVCIFASTFVDSVLVTYEWSLLKNRSSAPTWFAAIFWFAAFMANLAILDWIFFGWARLRFDMFVQSGCVRRSGAKYERGIYVRMEDETYFIPSGQELVLRNTVDGHAQVITAPESVSQK